MKPQQKRYSKVHESNEIYQNDKYAFVSEKFTLPNGVTSETAFVRHPGSAVIVPFFEDRTIGLIRQYRYAVDEYLYEIPAGTLRPGEDPDDCAARELEEETGYVAGRLVALGHVLLLPAYSDEWSMIFLATRLTQTVQKLDDDEMIEVFRFPMNEIREMIDRSRLVDALSIVAIYRAMRYLEHAALKEREGDEQKG